MKSKMLKRIIASLMCVGMLLSMVPMMSISAAYDYSDVVEKTTALNIIPEKIDAEDFVTRKELAKFMYYMLNVRENGAVYGTQQYTDIDKTSEYYEYVSVMAGSKLMIGISDTQFAPDMKVTFGMVARVLLNATGYYQLAREGTMESFTNVAASLGILKNVSYDANSEVLMGELAQMIWNAMQLNAVETTIQGESKYVVADTTLLWHYHKIAESRGKVTANEDTALNRAVGADEGCVVIDNVVYRAGTDYIKHMIGKNVRFYYKSHEDFDEPIVMWAELTDNKQLIFDATEIKTVVGTSFTTEIDNKEKVYSLSPVVNVIFNGKYRPFDARDLKPLIGNVELVDADGDRVYELAIVKSYIPFVVKSVDKDSRIIYDKTGRMPVTVDEEAKVKIKKDGASVALEVLEEGNVALVAADKTVYDANDVMQVNSADSMIYEVLVSTEVITGKASSVSLDEGYAVIEGTQYDIRATIDSTGNTNIKLGETATYYVDVFSNVVYVEVGTKTEAGDTAAENTAVGGGTYGFVTKIKHNEFDGTVTMRIFNILGEWGTYTLADKVRVDGVTYKKQAKAAFDALTNPNIPGKLLTDATAKPNTSNYAYALVYKLDDEGKIKYLDTPMIEDLTDEESNSTLSLSYDSDYGTSTGYLFMGIWIKKWSISNLVSIEVPYSDFSGVNKIRVDEDKERNFNIKKITGTIAAPELQIFNAGEERIPKFAISTKPYSNAGETLDNKYANYIITKVASTINDDNEEVIRLYLTGPEGAKTLDVDDNTSITTDRSTGGPDVITSDQLVKGDIIAYTSDGTTATNINRRFNLLDENGQFNDKHVFKYSGGDQIWGGDSAFETVWGKVHLIHNGVVQVYLGNDHSDIQLYDLQKKKIICYDMAENTFAEIDEDQIKAYKQIGQSENETDRIFIGLRRDKGTDIFVYRNVPTTAQ